MSGWLNWQPKQQILTGSPENEPAKPSEPGFAGFEGGVVEESSKIQAAVVGPKRAELARASGYLGGKGIRLMTLDGVPTVGIWSDTDGPELRAALAIMGVSDSEIRYLDGPGIPRRYKLRSIEGEPVSLRALASMMRR